MSGEPDRNSYTKTCVYIQNGEFGDISCSEDETVTKYMCQPYQGNNVMVFLLNNYDHARILVVSLNKYLTYLSNEK